ncbi:unnamed protein product [Calicophoron daubneyi]|uniref:Cell division cycle protein 123 homolog n=1 Tax=Calicophoron daubneyi TaxID=300641 RepID=A0AAV2TDX7_CALDB
MVRHIQKGYHGEVPSIFRNIIFTSVVLPMEKELVDSILADNILLPKNAKVLARPSPESSDDSDDESWSQSDESEDQAKRPEFPVFEAKLSRIINRLGGEVFPKLNWSAPKDASWMLCGNSLKCTTFSDVYLLLKSSDFIAHDLTAPYALCSDSSLDQLPQPCIDFQPTLVLRRWMNCRPDGEFRCFVRQKALIGISQRIHDAYFESIVANAELICQELSEFFKEQIRDRFPLSDYTFDVHRDPPGSDHPSDVTLIDFNVFGDPTEALLFTWSELEAVDVDQTKLPTFRYQQDRLIRPNTMSQYSLPIDFIEMASGSDPSKLVDFVQSYIEAEQNKR